MDLSRLDEGGICLNIGGFTIVCSAKTKLNGEVFHLPAPFMAFVQREKEPTELKFIVDESFLPDPGQLIFRVENFMWNSFYRRTDGGVDWCRRNGDDTPGILLHVLDSWSTLVLSQNTATPRAFRAQKLDFECGCAFNYAMLAHGACVFHGVVMEYEGKGVLITARSGVGKTTHARLWRDHENALILNGDRSLCRRIDGKWYAYGMPWCGSSGEYINRRVPISCIVELRRGETNRVEDVSPFDAAMYLLERIYAPVWEPELREKAVDRCQELGSSIPVVRLYCRPDPESVQVLKYVLQGL